MALYQKTGDGRRQVTKTLTIASAESELFSYWRDFERLPAFMDHLESVTVSDGKRSHWVARAPAGRIVEWDAELVDDIAPERISWRTLPGASVDHEGEITFKAAPGNRGTEVCVRLTYTPPAGAAGVAIARMFGEEPGQQLDEDLYRFKQLMETGSIPTTEGQPVGGRQLEKRVRHEERLARESAEAREVSR